MNIKAFGLFLIFTKMDVVASAAPTQCEDSILYFKLGGKTVSWCDMDRNAGGAETLFLCARGDAISSYVKKHCPATCGMTDCSAIESDLRFLSSLKSLLAPAISTTMYGNNAILGCRRTPRSLVPSSVRRKVLEKLAMLPVLSANLVRTLPFPSDSIKRNIIAIS
jgi:hypothetical protein